MRTLKIFVIAASLFLFAIPATAAIYLPEMPDIKSADIQFMCETPSLWFLKVYIAKTWQVFIAGRDKQELMMVISIHDERNVFVFIFSTNEWKNSNSLTNEEVEGLEKSDNFNPAEEDLATLQSCVESNLRRALKR